MIFKGRYTISVCHDGVAEEDAFYLRYAVWLKPKLLKVERSEILIHRGRGNKTKTNQVQQKRG